MNSFLFTWNPNKWNWVDLTQSIEKLKCTGVYTERWGIGNFKKIQKGDRAFLMRLGKAPKGIMGAGWISSEVYKSDHWNPSLGKSINYVDIDFEALINAEQQEILSLAALEALNPVVQQNWSPRQSGIQIKTEIARALELLWSNFLKDLE